MSQIIIRVLTYFGLGMTALTGLAGFGQDAIDYITTNYNSLSLSIDGNTIPILAYFSLLGIPDALGIILSAVFWRTVIMGAQAFLAFRT